MSDTNPREESIVSRLVPSQRTLATVVVVMMVLGSIVPLGAAQDDGDDWVVWDNFEDGDLDEWRSGGGSINSSVVFDGQFSMGFDPATNTPDNNLDLPDQIPGEAVTVIQWYVYPDEDYDPNDDDYGSEAHGRLRTDDGDLMVHIRNVEGNWVDHTGGSEIDLVGLEEDEWTEITVELDYNTNTYDVSINGTKYVTGSSFQNSGVFGNIQFGDRQGQSYEGNTNYDLIQIRDLSRITGVVQDQENNDLEDATVVAEEGGTEIGNVSTDINGQYEMFVPNGDYDMTASKDGFYSGTANVTVGDSDITQDFELINQSEVLNLNVRPFIEHGQSVPYEVIASPVNGTTGERDRMDVTADSILTSGNASVVTIDAINREVDGTSDTSVNGQTFVRADWTNPDTGNELTATQNVTVANATVNNLKILPPMNRFTAPLGGGTDDNPDDKTIAIIFIAVGAGIVASRWATSFAGGAATVMIFEMGWIMGMVGDGMAIVAVFIGLFVLLNVAGNVDYTVRR